MTLLITATLLSMPAAASTKPDPHRSPDRPAPSGVQRTLHPVRAVGVGCSYRRLRRAVRRLQASTWHWEDLVYHPRTRAGTAAYTGLGCGYLRWSRRLWSRRDHQAWRRWVRLREPTHAICYVFGPYCSEALRVAWCESKFSLWAENGQYLGMFQMGHNERRTYGHSTTALGQARAAHRYFASSGYDWSPWGCKP